jgi:ABC-type Fe3+-hydroxamate transport system substrate-binding protein
MTSSNRVKTITLTIIAVMIVSVFPVSLTDHSDAASSITVTDGMGKEFTFDDEPAHVITVGKGITATTIQLGAIDKIVVADSYSKSDTNAVFDILRTYVDEGKITAGGNIYSSGKAELQTEIVYAADNGKFDKEKDPVFITGGNSYINPIIDYLTTNGFKKVLAWNDITEYGKIADFVSTISKIVDGSESDKVAQMKHVSEVIADGVKDKTLREAFYVTYSGSAFKVGNINSLANSMISAAGGKSITTDDSKAKPTYETNLTTLVEDHPNAIIFIDNSIKSSQANLDSLKTAIGEDAFNNRVVPLNPLWNNYSIESMNGVWTMACAMYPDTFEGDVPTVDEPKKNTALYIGIGVGVAAVVLIAGLLFLKKR